MTDVERFNLQTGREENYYNRYTIESPLDSFIIQTHDFKARLHEEQQQKALEDYFMSMIDTKLQDCLEKALEDVLTGLNPL